MGRKKSELRQFITSVHHKDVCKLCHKVLSKNITWIGVHFRRHFDVLPPQLVHKLKEYEQQHKTSTYRCAVKDPTTWDTVYVCDYDDCGLQFGTFNAAAIHRSRIHSQIAPGVTVRQTLHCHWPQCQFRTMSAQHLTLHTKNNHTTHVETSCLFKSTKTYSTNRSSAKSVDNSVIVKREVVEPNVLCLEATNSSSDPAFQYQSQRIVRALTRVKSEPQDSCD